MTDITVPNVGESVSEVTIATWFKKVGDAVKKDEALVELETDKAAQELVAPEDGVLAEIVVAEGENAAVGALIARLSAGGAATADAAPKDKAAPAPAPAAANGASGGTALNIDVPNVGESGSEVTVANWMKKPGEAVAKDEPIVELETDKAARELVAPEAGVLEKILIGKYRQAGSATFLICNGQRGRVEVFADQALGRAGLLDLGNERPLALGVSCLKRSTKLAHRRGIERCHFKCIYRQDLLGVGNLLALVVGDLVENGGHGVTLHRSTH